MKCIVIDDEPLAREGMRLLIADISSLELCGSFSNVIDADTFIRNNPVDVIFLDIQMPKITGLDYLRNSTLAPKVILTTAYPQFAIDGFELDVLDYLVKPIRFDRFYKAVNKLFALQENNSLPLPAATEDDFIFIRSERKFIRMCYQDINYIEGLKDYVIIHCKTEKLTVAANLKSIHAQLPLLHFFRISKSFIVNVNRITSIDKDSVFINKHQISIGENYKEQIMEFIVKKGILKR